MRVAQSCLSQEGMHDAACLNAREIYSRASICLAPLQSGLLRRLAGLDFDCLGGASGFGRFLDGDVENALV